MDTMNNDWFEEAHKYRTLATMLKDAIGERPCECVSTPEYEAHEAFVAKNVATMNPVQRLWFLLNTPFDVESDDPLIRAGIAKECQRCYLLGVYGEAVGSDTIEYEIQKRLAQIHTEEEGTEGA